MKIFSFVEHILIFTALCYDPRFEQISLPDFSFSPKHLSNNILLPLIRNKRFLLDEMTRQNASKFAIFYIYENPKLHFSFRATLFFP